MEGQVWIYHTSIYILDNTSMYLNFVRTLLFVGKILSQASNIDISLHVCTSHFVGYGFFVTFEINIYKMI